MLASDATLSNGATENVAVIYGDVAATGTGAKMDGAFKFDGGTLAFRNVAANTRNLSTMLAFANPAESFLRDVGAITIDMVDRPKCGTVTVCQAGGLTAEEAQAKIVVTQNGEPVNNVVCHIKNGNIVLNIPVGFTIIVR